MNEIIFLAAGLLVGIMPFMLMYSRDTESMKQLRKATKKKQVAYIFHDFRGNMFIQTADIVKGTVNQLDVEKKYGIKLLTRDPSDVEFLDGQIKCVHYLVESVYSVGTLATKSFCSLQAEFKKRDLHPTPERIIILMEGEWEIRSDEEILWYLQNSIGDISTSIEQIGLLREIYQTAQQSKVESGPFVYSAAKDYLHSGGQNTSVAFSAWKTKLIEMLKSGQNMNGSLFGNIDIKMILILGAAALGAYFLFSSGILSNLGGYIP